MLKKSFLVVLVALCPGVASSLWASSIAVVGAVNHTKVTVGSTELGADGIGPGAGALLGLGSIELGVLYIHRKIGITIPASALLPALSVKEDVTAIQVPLLYRIGLGPVLSFGFGGYYVKYQSAKVTASFANDPKSTVTVTSDLKGSDYGLVGSLALNLPLSTSLGLLMDGRYNFGLKSSEKVREVQGLVGLSFSLGR